MGMVTTLAITTVVRFVLVITESAWHNKYKALKVMIKALDVAVIVLVMLMLFQTVHSYANAPAILV